MPSNATRIALHSASVAYEKNPPETLPVRGRSTLPRGRHRRPASAADLPPDAPALVLAVPGASPGVKAAAEGRRDHDEQTSTAAEIASLTRAAHADIDIRIGYLDGEPDGARTQLTEVLWDLGQSPRSGERPTADSGDVAVGDEGDEGDEAADSDSLADSDSPAGGRAAPSSPREPAAVVVPLLTGPNPRTYEEIRTAVSVSGAHVSVTEPLGPHPLLAEALHVRLAESGLARADRIRQFSIGATVDGVIVVTVGGAAAVQEADITSVLLAARLAVPVVAAGLDASPGVAEAAARLRDAGAARLALAPQFIGPEAGEELLASAAAEVEAEYAAPLGSHQGIVRLVNLRYEVALEELSSGAEFRSEEEAS
jgi:hypothetical protein